MRILHIATSFPFPPDDGTKIQRFERIRELSKRHDVTLLCVTSDAVPPDALRHMEQYCRCILLEVPPFIPRTTTAAKAWGMMRSIARNAPYYVLDRLNMSGIALLEREVETGHIDVVEADADATMYLHAASVGALKVAVLHSVHEAAARRYLAVMSGLVERLTLQMYHGIVRRYEGQLIRGVDLCVALTQESCLELQRLYPSSHIRNCLSNGVDLDYFSFAPPDRDPEGIAFVGKMDYSPNIDAVVWFYNEVFPLVRAALPRLRFSIIGSHPTAAVQALASDPAVEVTGYVDDVRPYIRRAGLAVLPLRMGGGILNKLLQSLSMGVPVVATPLALEGLGVVAGRDLLVAQSAPDIASAVIRLAGDRALRMNVASAGRGYVEEHHQWSAMVGRYESEIERLLRRRQPQFGQNAPAADAVARVSR